MTKEHLLKMQLGRKNSRLLKDEFVYNTFLYKRIVDKEGDLHPGFHIYIVSDSWNNSWYEAFYTINDKLPTNEAFGNTAYCCKSLDDAWRCIGVLEAKIKKRFERKQNKDKKEIESQNFL